jgi:shikimate kinase
MGAGKTAVGRLAASRWGCPFLDVDDLVEEAAGSAVREIFGERGESEFRRLERDALRTACRSEGAVIACGGGAVLFPENRTLLKERCFVIWLKASPETLEVRLGPAERCMRPLLAGADAGAALRDLLARREQLYRLADAAVDTDGRSVEDVAERVMATVGAWVEGG